MKIIVSLGPIIGVIVAVIYAIILKIYAMVKGSKSITKKHKIIQTILVLIEIILILISFIVPALTGKSYLIEGMATGTNISISEEKFKVHFQYANRGYTNRIYLDEDELKNVTVECSAEDGNVFLFIMQDNNEKSIDITNRNSVLDMSDFRSGDISFTLKNENAHNVKFELIW